MRSSALGVSRIGRTPCAIRLQSVRDLVLKELVLSMTQGTEDLLPLSQ